jgi:protoporphyrinogen oxidase
MKIAIIGSGPAGITAAYALTKSIPTVDVYEASDSVGGLARSIKLWGQTVDIGPHRFFSRDRRVNELWLEVVGHDYAMVDRLTRILYKGRFFQYPLQPWNALAKLGPVEAARCASSYAREILSPNPDHDSFEGWVSGRFGRRLYEIFFKSYSEKLWGIPCTELDASFAAQRIKQFSLAAAVKAALSFNGKTQHATLVDQFAYPLEGTGMVYSRMSQAVEHRGGHVFLKTPIARVITSAGKVTGVELSDGAQRPYDAVLSSMPLTLLVSRLSEAPQSVRDLAGKLSSRNTILIYLLVNSDSVCKDNWLYVQDSDLRTGRITNFRNWVPQLYGDSPNTILSMEYWCNNNDELWQSSDEALIRLARQELVATSLIDNESLVTDGLVYRIPRCYPVYRRGYRQILGPIQQYLSKIDGLQVIGRYGAFKYNNQDHSILMGLLAAENVLGRAEHDLWEVNCDYETYQESTRITETGLVAAAN